MGGITKTIFGGGNAAPQIIVREIMPVETESSAGANSTKNQSTDEIRRRAVNASGYSNINTSSKGVLEPVPELPKRKTLLGE